MPRNLVICCDGTNNQFGTQNTNVVRLVQLLDRNPTLQRLYYDPGVGTLPEPGWVTWLGTLISDFAGLAFGAGLVWKVQEAYTYLMNMWESGDSVFLFGFSRGAYTVRVLAGLLHELGLLPRGNDNLVPYATRLFKTALKDHGAGKSEAKSKYWQLREDFRKTFARPAFDGDTDRRFPVHFLGLWDTVSSVGWVWDPKKFPFTAHNPSIRTIRHAVSVDERRWFFRQNLMEQMDNQDLRQCWFPGVHCDVGGGYPEAESGLWRLAFEWMLKEAENAGLKIDPARRVSVLAKTPGSPAPWRDEQHESLTPIWWLAEFFPKLCWVHGVKVPMIGLGRHRYISEGQLIHSSTLLRIRETSYAPPNMCPQFIERVRALQVVPDCLPYAC
jgi:uncharacterized protein (DUF2235 family)